MFVDTAVWVGFVFGFMTAWKILPFIGQLLHRRSACDIELWRNRHRRCEFCAHSNRDYLGNLYLGNWYCNAKRKVVSGSLPRFACPLFKQKRL